jgi:DNA (cytosine-5)-methyltransferase 1
LKKLRVVSLFSGCGGLDLGFIMANENLQNFKYEIVWANDFNQLACETYKNNFGDHIVCGDITDPAVVDFNNLPECEVILGGFPCQDFSMLWKRGGIETERGNLYLQFVKAIERDKQ